MAISLKLADDTTPLYAAPDYAPLAYAGIDVDTAPPRTPLRVARDAVYGLAWYAFLMLRTIPAVLRLLALVVIGAAYVLVAVGWALHWTVTRGPQLAARALAIAAKPVTVPMSAYQRSRIPFAELAEIA